jgi:hypothetical protein
MLSLLVDIDTLGRRLHWLYGKQLAQLENGSDSNDIETARVVGPLWSVVNCVL